MEYAIVRANATKGRPEFFDLCGCQPNHYMTEMVSLLRGLTFKHESTPASAFCGSLVMLSGLALAETFVREVVGAEEAMLFIGSFAAMATLLFAAPAAPLGIPWNTLLGHGVSISIALGGMPHGEAQTLGWHHEPICHSRPRPMPEQCTGCSC